MKRFIRAENVFLRICSAPLFSHKDRGRYRGDNELMPTIKDVAQLAGVSVGTVSRVLAKNKTVNDAIRLKVEEVIEKLGYRPNSLGRNLRRNKTDLIGLVIPDITNPFFAELAKHVEMLASAEGYSVLLANTHDEPAAELQQVDTLLGRLPEGMIVVPVSGSRIKAARHAVRTIAVDRPRRQPAWRATGRRSSPESRPSQDRLCQRPQHCRRGQSAHGRLSRTYCCFPSTA
jgi:hypothetical protein